MQVWMAKFVCPATGPDILVFRAGLEDKIMALPPDLSAGATFTVEQVTITYYVISETFFEALDQARIVLNGLEVPQRESGFAIMQYAEVYPLSEDPVE